MERLKSITIIILLVVGLFSFAVYAKSASVLLQEGMYAEQTKGDLEAAIKIYEQIIADSSAERPHIAQAMYHLGMCYMKKKDENNARLTFENLVSQFPDQTKIIEEVQPLLEKLGGPDPAELMPPHTKVYVEIGNPGRQLETVLNMLRGTPLENPLAALSQGQIMGPGGKTPGQMLAAFLNPSMMAEFKKIRGFAIGVTGFSQNNPPMIAVLYPGKSDALRGMILAGLGMAGMPGQPIEDMQTIMIQGTAGVAYDNNVVIIAQPVDQLQWCVKKYKGLSDEPTLASENKAFSKISRQDRQNNAITTWVDVAGSYPLISEIMNQTGQAGQLHIADVVADLKNIEDVISYVSIRARGLAVGSEINFKQGHNCILYNMIRTPNLDRKGFEVVPSDAIALASIAFSESGDLGVETAQKTVKKLTGLDIGREIFANIEQVNIFAMPPGQSSKKSATIEGQIASCLGLAITSHNSQQTQQMLHQILSIIDVATRADNNIEPGNPKQDGYLLGVEKDQPFYCYLGNTNKATFVALSHDVIEASVSAAKNQKSVLTGGALQEPLAKLPSDTSKLLFVNVGGVIALADSCIKQFCNNPRNPGHQLVSQLAEACDKTYIQFNSSESDNNYSTHTSIEDLPPMDQVVPLLMQLSKIDLLARAIATNPMPTDKAVLGPKEEIKLKWETGAGAVSHKVYFGTNADKLSLLAEVQSPDELESQKIKKDTTYYWRVDEIMPDNSTLTGDVWSFGTTGKLVGWWKMDETEGDIAADSSGNNNSGTLQGNAAWIPTAGKIGGAIKLDGDGDFVELMPESNFDITRQITVAAWIRVNKFDTQWQAIITKGDNSWRIHRFNETDGIEFACSGTSVNDYGSIAGKMSVNDRQWHHIVGVYDGAKMYIYVDGKLDTARDSSGSINSTDDPVYIGENATYRERFFNGLIDDVRVYNYALSQDEIKALYEVKASRPKPADGSVISDVKNVQVDFIPGRGAVSHKIYFGTDADNLSMLKEVSGPEKAKLPKLEKDKTYFWRVDEVSETGSVIEGDIWSFATTGRLIGWWKFDEKKGDKAADSSENNNTGMLRGDPTWMPSEGKIGGAIKLDGDGDYIEITNEAVFDITGPITVAAWVNINSINSEWAGIVTKGDSAWRISTVFAEKRFHFAVTDSVWSNGQISVGANQWHHVVGVYDGQQYRTYIDGKLDISQPWAGGITTNDYPVCIGENIELTGRCFNGLIDDVRIYNYALSEDQITELYENK